MPFVVRKVEPRFLCRGHVPPGTLPVGGEMESIAHGALTGCLKQLASVLTLAEDIFADLTSELTVIADRSGTLRLKVDKVEDRLGTIDPKKIPVPESDISTFAARKEHFHMKSNIATMLFTPDSRPKILRELYEAAAVIAVRNLDSIDGDGQIPSELYLCTPVLGKRRSDYSLDIEARVPAAIEDLRRWTSAEALGDVTVPPDCMSRILADTTDDAAVDHKLPSPEEQLQAVALKFPAEVVAVDISGRGFERMSIRRRSLLSSAVPDPQDVSVKRRSRPRRPRGKRRNTIAGIDQKEIRQAIEGETTVESQEDGQIPSTSRTQRSASTDILGSKKESPSEKKSHFDTLKAWGMSRLKMISPKSTQNVHKTSPTTSSQNEGQSTDEKLDDTNIYETVMMRRRKEKYAKEKFHERKPSSSSSSSKSTTSIPVSMPAPERQVNVKLRESAAQRRERRKGNREDAPHSSSGNWSASSESGRASVGSENTTTTHPPRSTTTASIGTSSTSLSHVRRTKGRETSASSSVTSEGTLTPDIIHDISVVPFSDDGENSSVYSCDTEGYYTSFHVDSGLKTLREEEALPQSPLVKSCDLSPDLASPIAENEYELFGRGSTSTTTSSAGTVCTALLAPPPPERKSSLTVVAMVHGQNGNGGQSPDSGHNTSSSPVESASSPACTGRSCSEFEYSESSDLEGCERVERIRSKTAINASRIPSMCVITPPGSDDEASKDLDNFNSRREMLRNELENPGSILMSATVGTSKMEVINGQDKNPYATVQTVPLAPTGEKSSENNTRRSTNQGSAQAPQSFKVSPSAAFSNVLGKLRGVLPGTKRTQVVKDPDVENRNADSGDYVTIADVRNNNNKRSDRSTVTSVPDTVTYTNSDLFQKDVEYVSLSELPKKPDSSLERIRQGARVTLDSEGKVVYSSDSLRRRKGAHTTFNPGPFVKEGVSPATSPLLRRGQTTIRAVNRDRARGDVDTTDSATKSTPPTSPQLGKLIIRAPKSPERASSPSYVRTPSTIVGPTSPTSPQKHLRGAYVNVQGDEDNSPALVVPIDSVLPDKPIPQTPPPYVEPPQFISNQENSKYRVSLPRFSNNQQIREHNPQAYAQDQARPYNQNYLNRNYESGNGQGNQEACRNQEAHDAARQRVSREAFDRNARLFLQRQQQNYARNQKALQRELVDPRAPKEEHFYVPSSNYSDNNQQFYTLPAHRPHREVESPRSVTPDITRGLGRRPLITMHMMARTGQTVGVERDNNANQFGSSGYLNANDRNAGQHLDQRGCSERNQNPVGLDVRNRFKVPASLAAVGYRFIASSSMHDLHDTSSPARDPLRYTPLSPIAPSSAKGFQSSTPGKDSSALRQTIDRNAKGAIISTDGSFGRNTPSHLILPQAKSTMSNEELFAAIHKSKKRLNIKEDTENLSPSESMTSLTPHRTTTEHGWSPAESQRVSLAPPTGNPQIATSRLNFKRLLLQQSIKTGPTRLSAAEQLKLSRQQNQQQHQQQEMHYQQGHQINPPMPPVKVLSPRTAWRFQSPRSDVLSSTIIEDSAAEEKAMKPSPENPSPIARTNIKKQLDMCSDPSDDRSKRREREAEITLPMEDDTKNSNHVHSKIVSTPSIKNDGIAIARTLSVENRCNSSEAKYCTSDRPGGVGNRAGPHHLQGVVADVTRLGPTTETAGRKEVLGSVNESISGRPFVAQNPRTTSHSSDLLSSAGQQRATLTAAEARRINNQLARAQFLASNPVTTPTSRTVGDRTHFQKCNRARSESPQHGLTENVPRSPSAPTLETAL